jgi:hypothetical protein
VVGCRVVLIERQGHVLRVLEITSHREFGREPALLAAAAGSTSGARLRTRARPMPSRAAARTSRPRRPVPRALGPVSRAQASVDARDLRRKAARPKPAPRLVPLQKLAGSGLISFAEAAGGEQLARDW